METHEYAAGFFHHRLINKGKKQYQAREVGGKVSEHFFDHGLCLPSGTAITQADLDRVIAVILKTGSC
jgi:dTDP-4-amino-4,6-dideoxygalactose transaminase